MIELRDYQQAAINAAAQSLKSYKRVVLLAPTASGKGVIIAGLCRRIIDSNPTARILVLCYIAEVIEQNVKQCEAMGVHNNGIYCAGLKCKDTVSQVIHASRDSLGRDPLVCGKFEFVIVDECHSVSMDHEDDSYYHRILSELNPKYLIGLTGTPWRIKGGLIYGKRKFWEHCAYNISMELLIKRGYLSPYKLPEVKQLVDASAVKVVAGEYNTRELDKLTATDDVIAESVKLWFEHASDRLTTLFFCTSIVHAKKLHEVLQALHGMKHKFAYLDGATNKEERNYLIAAARKAKYKGIVNVNCLTTGTDIPVIDCIVWLRPTRSASLFVQGTGRGLRVFKGKSDCLILDMVGNFDSFGSLDRPFFSEYTSDKRKFTPEELIAMGIDPTVLMNDLEQPTKECPECGAILAIQARKCDECDHIFIKKPVLAYESREYYVSQAYFVEVTSKAGNNMIKVTYKTTCGDTIQEFVLYKPRFGVSAWQRREQIRQQITKIRARKDESGYWKVVVLDTLKNKYNTSSSPGSRPTELSAGESTRREYSIKKLGDIGL